MKKFIALFFAIVALAFLLSCSKDKSGYTCGTVVSKYSNNGKFVVVSANGTTFNASISADKYETVVYGDGVCTTGGKVIE